MVLQGNAIFEIVRTAYESFSSEDLWDNLVGLFTSAAPGTALFDRLDARINQQKRYKKRARTPFGRFIHLLRLSPSFWSSKCLQIGDVYCYVSFLRY